MHKHKPVVGARSKLQASNNNRSKFSPTSNNLTLQILPQPDPYPHLPQSSKMGLAKRAANQVIRALAAVKEFESVVFIGCSTEDDD